MRYPALPMQTIHVFDVDTRYATLGDRQKPPVVLLHGMTSSADTWRELVHKLAGDFYLIAPDLPGFGESAMTQPYTLSHLVEWLAGFCDALDLHHFHLVGHSFGGALAAQFAATYPENVARLVLAAPAILVNSAFPNLVKHAAIGSGLVDLSQVVTQSRVVVNQAVRASFVAPEKLDDSIWERRVRMYDQARASAEVLKALAFEELGEVAARIEAPTLLLWGDTDTVVPTSQAEDVAALIDDSRLVMLPDCGHILQMEQEAAFAALTSAFLQGDGEPDRLQFLLHDALRPRPIISVFGSSAPKEGEPEYEQAREVGRLLAEAGCTVATGGYMGTMEAVSRGASEAGGSAVGVTSDQIETFRPIGPNPYLTEEVRHVTLRDRLLHLVDQNEGMIVLPGGIGTLSEMSLAWSFLQTGELTPRPLVLLGDGWRGIVSAVVATDHISEKDADLLTFAATPQAAVEAVLRQLPTTSTQTTP